MQNGADSGSKDSTFGATVMDGLNQAIYIGGGGYKSTLQCSFNLTSAKTR